MKVRTGFVSNSSSSSFCLVGATIDDYGGGYKEFLGKDYDKELEYWQNSEKIATKLEKLGMEVHEGEESVVFGYPVETDTTIDSQVEWTEAKWEELGIKKKPSFMYGEICSG